MIGERRPTRPNGQAQPRVTVLWAAVRAVCVREVAIRRPELECRDHAGAELCRAARGSAAQLHADKSHGTRSTATGRSPPLPGLGMGRRADRAVKYRVRGAHRLYTLGYEARILAEFLDRLAQAGVSRLVDVRESPRSRRPGFSKTKLRKRRPRNSPQREQQRLHRRDERPALPPHPGT